MNREFYSYWKIEERGMIEYLDIYDSNAVLVYSVPLSEVVETFLSELDLKEEQKYLWKNEITD